MSKVPPSVQQSSLESKHQQWIVKWLRKRNILFTAPANGTHSSMSSRMTAFREGMQCGVPDLLIFSPRHGFCGLAIEMKRPRKFTSRVSPEQEAYHTRLQKDANWAVFVCYGAEEAHRLLLWWFDAPQHNFSVPDNATADDEDAHSI